jgi:hypothetical protein
MDSTTQQTKDVTPDNVPKFLLTRYFEPIKGTGFYPVEVPDNLDFFLSGVIDSFGILEMISSINGIGGDTAKGSRALGETVAYLYARLFFWPGNLTTDDGRRKNRGRRAGVRARRSEVRSHGQINRNAVTQTTRLQTTGQQHDARLYKD